MIARGQFQQRFVDVQAFLKTNSQLAKARKPSVCPLNNPAISAQFFAALSSSPRNPASNASAPETGVPTWLGAASARRR